VDVAAALPLLGEFEHAIVLLDVSSKVVRRPTTQASTGPESVSLRLDQLQGAVILRAGGRQREVLELLNRVIGRYTNAEVASLERQSCAGFKFQQLADERLPGWAVWQWGRLDEFFVVTFGAGTFEEIARTYSRQTPNLGDDRWFASATVKTQGDRAFTQWFIALSKLEARLAPTAKGRQTRVFAALQADGMTHDLWTVGREGRALTWYRCYRRAEEDRLVKYSDPAAFPARHRRIVPDEAAHYAVIHVPVRWLVDNLPRAWVAAGSESRVQTWSRVWQRLEEETGIDIDGQLFSHLGEHIVIFDYPPHPLRVPFAWTVAFEIDDREPVEVALNAILSAWSRYLDERAMGQESSLVRVKVRHDRDGVWYLQAGILGPALKVVDGYVVVSWSPQALRDALKYIETPPKSGERQ
jgi:hypothetical protein